MKSCAQVPGAMKDLLPPSTPIRQFVELSGPSLRGGGERGRGRDGGRGAVSLRVRLPSGVGSVKLNTGPIQTPAEVLATLGLRTRNTVADNISRPFLIGWGRPPFAPQG